MEFAMALAVLDTLPAPRGGLSHNQIAELCGCSHTTIWLIEQKAFRKLRALIRRSLPPGEPLSRDGFLDAAGNGQK